MDLAEAMGIAAYVAKYPPADDDQTIDERKNATVIALYRRVLELEERDANPDPADTDAITSTVLEALLGARFAGDTIPGLTRRVITEAVGPAVMNALAPTLAELLLLRRRVAELEAGDVQAEWGVRDDAGMVSPRSESGAQTLAHNRGGTIVRREVRTTPWRDA